jgi:C1A family cysteine protease
MTSYEALPLKLDGSKWCSRIRDQGSLKSSAAHACISIIEYLQKKLFSKYVQLSSLFTYKVQRNLLHEEGDTGSYPRIGAATLRLFGAPPEEYWPYNIPDFDKEPPAFCYSLAQNFRARNMLRLDHQGVSKSSLLMSIKRSLADGFPTIFGFTIYDSISQAKEDGMVRCPCQSEKIKGGHSVMAFGYDDKIKIENHNCKEVTTGALRFQNSWGENWGDKGYGWLPYDYVLRGLTEDWWTVYDIDFVDLQQFGLPMSF